MLINQEKRAKIIAALREWEVLEGEPAYEAAVKQLADYLHVAYPEQSYRCTVGDYALCADGFGIFDKKELEQVRARIEGKKFVFRKSKVGLRPLATVNFYLREYVVLAVPGLVLYEIMGVSEEAALQMCSDASAELGIKLVLRAAQEL